MVACLYSDVSTGGENPTTMRTFSVMTTCTTKSSGIDWLHSRMPLICTTREACFEWLKVSTLDAGMEVIKNLRNSQPPAFVTHPVTKKINKTGAKVECPWKVRM
jgi:putative SOS response-associated peptidase YedK